MLAVVNCFFGACSAACSIVPGSSGLFCCLFNCGWVIRIIGCQASCQPFSQMRSIENTLPDSICSTNIQQDSYSRLLYGYGEIITNHPLIIGYYRLNTVNTHIYIYVMVIRPGTQQMLAAASDAYAMSRTLCCLLVVSYNGGYPKMVVYNGKSYENWWFGGTPILGNLQLVVSTISGWWFGTFFP